MGKGSHGGPSWSEVQGHERQMQQQSFEFQRQMQEEAEARLEEKERKAREEAEAKRKALADAKEVQRVQEEKQEAAVMAELTGQAVQESDGEGGGYNLDAPTIERPEYEQEDRPV
jgi:hypothetical protein